MALFLPALLDLFIHFLAHSTTVLFRWAREKGSTLNTVLWQTSLNKSKLIPYVNKYYNIYFIQIYNLDLQQLVTVNQLVKEQKIYNNC